MVIDPVVTAQAGPPGDAQKRFFRLRQTTLLIIQQAKIVEGFEIIRIDFQHPQVGFLSRFDVAHARLQDPDIEPSPLIFRIVFNRQ